MVVGKIKQEYLLTQEDMNFGLWHQRFHGQ